MTGQKRRDAGFPNEEVREGFAECLYKYYMEDYVGSGDALGIAFSVRFQSDQR